MQEIEQDYLQPKFLDKIFSEINRGYSILLINNKDKLFLKHYSVKELEFVSEIYDFYKNKAINSGLITLKDLKKRLSEEGVWSDEEESKLLKLQEEEKSLQVTSRNLFLEKDKKPIQGRLKVVSSEIKKILRVKNKLFTNHAEEYAEKQCNQKVLRFLVFKDKKLKKLKFSEEEFDEIEDSILNIITKKQQETSELLSDGHIQQLSISPPFVSLYNLFHKDLHSFFDKPVTKLSFYQINLLNYAKLFSSIFLSQEIPKEISKNAEKILKYVEDQDSKKKHVKNTEEKSSRADGFSYAGATRKDLEKMGVNTKGAKDIHKIAEEKGGELSMEDFLKIHNK